MSDRFEFRCGALVYQREKVMLYRRMNDTLHRPRRLLDQQNTAEGNALLSAVRRVFYLPSVPQTGVASVGSVPNAYSRTNSIAVEMAKSYS